MNIRRPIDSKKKRNRHDSKKKIIIATGSVVFLLAVMGIVIGIRQSSLFRIRTTTVSGIPEAYGEQVRLMFEDFSREHSWLFRFLGNGNILAWDGTPKEFLEAHPEFVAMRIEKDLIRHAIRIEVDERKKFGVWCRMPQDTTLETAVGTSPDDGITGSSEDEECYWFDSDGILFSRAPQIQSELFNRVHDFTGRTLAVRDRILPDRLFINLVRVFKLIEIAQINTKTVSLRDIALEEVEADSLTDPRTVFSLRFDPSFSLSAIDALKKTGEWSKLQYASFTVENRVSYR